MTFKYYLEHSEPIFKDLNILDNIFKVNDYLTALFMFRYYTTLIIYQISLKIIL
jgi:hypothetical protein